MSARNSNDLTVVTNGGPPAGEVDTNCVTELFTLVGNALLPSLVTVSYVRFSGFAGASRAHKVTADVAVLGVDGIQF